MCILNHIRSSNFQETHGSFSTNPNPTYTQNYKYFTDIKILDLNRLGPCGNRPESKLKISKYLTGSECLGSEGYIPDKNPPGFDTRTRIKTSNYLKQLASFQVFITKIVTNKKDDQKNSLKNKRLLYRYQNNENNNIFLIIFIVSSYIFLNSTFYSFVFQICFFKIYFFKFTF